MVMMAVMMVVELVSSKLMLAAILVHILCFDSNHLQNNPININQNSNHMQYSHSCALTLWSTLLHECSVVRSYNGDLSFIIHWMHPGVFNIATLYL